MKYEFSKITSIPEVVKIREELDLTDPIWQEAEKRLRELLGKKYDKEQALCLKNTCVPSYIKPGFVSAKEMLPSNAIASTSTADLLSELSKISEFVPRQYCEYNPLYKQIIPYMIGVTPSGKIFTMERIAGDDRLIGKISVGIGGHINVEDEGKATIAEGARRELDEEVQGVKSDSYLTLEGFLYDPSNTVGLDHIGFVFLLHLSDENISIKEYDKHKGYLSTKEELSLKKEKMENWTQIVYDNILSK